MINRKLLEFIGLLSKEQKKGLSLFLSSPYFNKGANAPLACRLYDLILQYNANPEHPKLRRESVAKQLFKTAVFGEKERNRLDKTGSGLLTLVERFLVQHDFDSNSSTMRMQLPLLKFYRQHQLEERFWQASEAAQHALETSPFRDAKHYFELYELHMEVGHVSSLFSSLKKDLGLDKADRALDDFIAIAKLETEIGKRFQAKLFNAPHQPSMLTNALWEGFFSQSQVLLPVAAGFLHEIMLMLDEPPSVDQVEDLENRIYACKSLFPVALNQYLLACCRNFMIRNAFYSPEPLFREKTFQMMDRHLRDGIIFLDGKITTYSLRTFMVSALKLGKVTWARQLLEDFPPERITGTRYPVDFYHLNWAYFYFYQQDYENAEKLVAFRNFEYQLFGLLAEVQLIKIYFETASPLLDARLKALEQKIRRSTQTNLWKQRLSNFVKHLDKVVQLQGRKDETARKKIQEKIKSVPEIVEKEWLLRKAG